MSGLAEMLKGYLGGDRSPPPEGYDTPLRPMIDPAARTRAVGGSPEFQGKVDETLRDAVREGVEPFKQVGRAISGRSDNPVPEGLAGGLGVAMAIPGGIAKGALRAGAKALGGEALEDILKPAAKSATGGVEDMIKAYHGSPHDFERFDLSKIGTGEGAQSYGHGLYFAESKGVADAYRKGLTNVTFNGRPWDRSNPLQTASTFEFQHGSREKALAETEKDLAKASHWEDKEHLERVVNALKGDKPLPKIDAPGKMYEVGIRANPEHFLDWDKPLSEQHPKVQEAIHGLTRGNEELQSMLPKASGETVLNRLLPMHGIGRGGASLDHGAISETLREAGIPGIKYLDQGSRDPAKMKELANDLAQYREAAKHWEATGNTEKLNIANKQIDVLSKRLQQTRNYVVFDDKLIDILKKYGIAGIGALPAMNAFHYQDKTKQ